MFGNQLAQRFADVSALRRSFRITVRVTMVPLSAIVPTFS